MKNHINILKSNNPKMNLPDLIKTGESETIEFKGKFDERCIESSVALTTQEGVSFSLAEVNYVRFERLVEGV